MYAFIGYLYQKENNLKADSNSNENNNNNNNNDSATDNRISKYQTVFLKQPKRFVSNRDKFYLKAVKRVLSKKGMIFLRVTEAQKRNYRTSRKGRRQQNFNQENPNVKNMEIDKDMTSNIDDRSDRNVASQESKEYNNSKKNVYLKPTTRNLTGYGRQMLMLLLQAAKLDTHC